MPCIGVSWGSHKKETLYPAFDQVPRPSTLDPRPSTLKPEKGTLVRAFDHETKIRSSVQELLTLIFCVSSDLAMHAKRIFKRC
jgi:hypothetical protein